MVAKSSFEKWTLPFRLYHLDPSGYLVRNHEYVRGIILLGFACFANNHKQNDIIDR